MTPFTTLAGEAVAIEGANIDTDQIIPARFLRKDRSAGYQNFLFHDLRAEPGFPLNGHRRRHPRRGAEFRLRLVARRRGVCARGRRHTLRDRA